MERQPRPGQLLPLRAQAYGIREKLIAYCLNPEHRVGGAKAAGFAVILGITIDSADYLEAEIRRGIQRHPVAMVVTNPPYGLKCVVDFPMRGIDSYSDREANVRTVWELVHSSLPPRLISAFVRDRP